MRADIRKELTNRNILLLNGRNFSKDRFGILYISNSRIFLGDKILQNLKFRR